MKVFHDLQEWRRFKRTETLGFVPTMGALHDGHLSLIRRSQQENQRTLVSIFINPTQFNDPKDFQNYPQTLEQDLAKLQHIDYVLAPNAGQIYPHGYHYKVSEDKISNILEGAHRPGHFDGMLTVVLKLLNLARADRAYFGEKDFQQLQLVRGMAEDFFLDTEIVACPTVREADGLAMSSRNIRLQSREKAGLFPKLLKHPNARALLEEAGFEVDYIENWQGRTLGAVRLDNVRLIDNL
ncbi:MAG: pantoate--beta-alanine ligase [Candidatus Eremiobacteraeota bacterium]|nr:pantoate--beta-alanine ligase [Candidatus Eremiobacteraeota bacterium]MCW5866197.1 pantoate--beta-alanine ligase [Candidatus Eremiobacteraeota bacterium]